VTHSDFVKMCRPGGVLVDAPDSRAKVTQVGGLEVGGNYTLYICRPVLPTEDNMLNYQSDGEYEHLRILFTVEKLWKDKNPAVLMSFADGSAFSLPAWWLGLAPFPKGPAEGKYMHETYVTLA